MVKHKLKRSKMKMTSRMNGSLLPCDDEDSDSDAIQEFSLPKKRIIKPGKSAYTARRRWNCCRTCASIFLSLILIASILCVVVLGWFSLRLKRDLDTMKKRIIKVESFDRSTSREYAGLQKDLDDQIVKLQHSQDSLVDLDKQHFLSVLKQLAFLNRTVAFLNEKVKSPQSATKINEDIESLKKGMADIGQEITQVKDQVAQLKNLAQAQDTTIGNLKEKLWNLTVQVVHLTGKPMPNPPKVAATPPLILRVPIQSDLSGKEQSSADMFKNLTTRFAVEIGHVRGFITSVNNSLASRIDLVQTKVNSLVKNIRNHMVQVDELSKEMDSFKSLESFNNNNNKTGEHGVHFPVKVEENTGTQSHNVSLVLTRVVHDVHEQEHKLSLLMSQMILMNRSIHHQEVSRQNNGERKQTALACNCSGVFQEVKRMIDADEKILESIRAELEQMKLTTAKPNESQSPAAAAAPASLSTLLPITVVRPGSTLSSESVPRSTKNTFDIMKPLQEVEMVEEKLEGEKVASNVQTQGVAEEKTTVGRPTEAVPQKSSDEVNGGKITTQRQNTTAMPVLAADNTEPPAHSNITKSTIDEEERRLELPR